MIAPLLLALACSRATLTDDDGSTDDGSSSGGGSSSSSSSSGGGGSSSGGGSTSSSSSSAGGTTTDDDETTGGSFIKEPDGGSSWECETYEQDCPAGEKCNVWADDGGSSWNATKCVPVVPDPRAVGERCTMADNWLSGVDDCDFGATCWYVDSATNQGMCLAFCRGHSEEPVCADACEPCLIYGNGLPAVCLQGCDPLQGDCPDGQRCLFHGFARSFTCMPDAVGGEGQYKDPCDHEYACASQLLCANADRVPGCAGDIGCCVPFCKVEAPDPGCPDTDLGVQCIPCFGGGHDPSCLSREIGACLLP